MACLLGGPQRADNAAILGAGAMQDCKEADILSVTTTLGSAGQAQELARALVQARLAACVQVDPPMTSTYNWNGQLCEEAEVRLTIKTLPACRQAVQDFLARHHPYDTPQFLAQVLRASDAYAAWVRSEVGLSAA
jgi:periplasmic divalent cation tolerance protein